MPIGKNSIQRAAKTGAAEKVTPETKPAEAPKKEAAEKEPVEIKITENVIPNLSPEVEEMLIGKKSKKKKKEPAPDDGKIPLTKDLPDYLL